MLLSGKQTGQKMRQRSLCWLVLVQVFLHSTFDDQVAAKVPALIVFGDSTVDAGNNNNINTVAKSNFAPYGRDFKGGRPTGRFSNGRIPTDFMSEAFGLKPTVPAYLDPSYSIKDFATGVSFASAGSGYDNATSDVLSVISLWKQLEYYKEYQGSLRRFLGAAKANEILSEALYVVSIGANDFLENYYAFPGRSSQFTIEEYQNFLFFISERFITKLYHLGARKMDLTGVPPMGCLPLERAMNVMAGSSCNEDYNKISRGFNRKLQEMADKLNRTLPGMRIAYCNAYDIVLQVIERPLAYGFDNADVGCCATGVFEMGYMCNRRNPLTCSDANRFVFWDAFHPTERMSKIIADYLMKNSLFEFL